MKENHEKIMQLKEKEVILQGFLSMSRLKAGHRINKKAIAMMVILGLFAVPTLRNTASAQIIIMSEDEYNTERNRGSGTAFVPLTPQGWNDDWYPDYAPLGNGMLLLAGLGASYLMGKKMRDKKRRD